jgi:hypothetical protein
VPPEKNVTVPVGAPNPLPEEFVTTALSVVVAVVGRDVTLAATTVVVAVCVMLVLDEMLFPQPANPRLSRGNASHSMRRREEQALGTEVKGIEVWAFFVVSILWADSSSPAGKS